MGKLHLKLASHVATYNGALYGILPGDFHGRMGPSEGPNGLRKLRLVKPWRYCMKLIITSKKTQIDKYLEKFPVHGPSEGHQMWPKTLNEDRQT